MRYPLPYAFARDHGLLLEDDEQQLTLWFSAETHRQALSEVTRQFALARLNCLSEDAITLRQRIQQKAGAPTIVRHRTGVKRDGTITAMDVDLRLDVPGWVDRTIGNAVVKDKLTEMVHLVETNFAGAIGSSAMAKRLPAGSRPISSCGSSGMVSRGPM